MHGMKQFVIERHTYDELLGFSRAEDVAKGVQFVDGACAYRHDDFEDSFGIVKSMASLLRRLRRPDTQLVLVSEDGERLIHDCEFEDSTAV